MTKATKTLSITLKTPAAKFNDCLYVVSGYKDSDMSITGTTLQATALEHLVEPAHAVFTLGHLLMTASGAALTGNEEAISRAQSAFKGAAIMGGHIDKNGKPSDQFRNSVDSMHPIVNAWLNALREHGRYVDTLFSISNSKTRQRLLGLLRPQDELQAMFSGGSEWNTVFASIGECQEVSKRLAEAFTAAKEKNSFA